MPRENVSIFLLLAAVMLLTTPSFGSETIPLVLFEQGHGQRFLIDDNGKLQLSILAETIRVQGVKVSATNTPLTDTALNGVAALVISGPFKHLKPEEVEAVVRFVKNGGRLAIMMHIGAPLTELLNRLDVDYSIGVLHEQRENLDTDLSFRLKDLSASPLFTGIETFSAHGVWALKPGATSTIIAKTSPDAWIDLNGDGALSKGDPVGSFGVVAVGTLGAGNFVVFGDDAIFQNRFLDENNKKLAVNLGHWLTGR